MPNRPDPPTQASRPEQLENAPSALQVVIYDPAGNTLFNERVRLRQYSSGSWGWHTAGKMDCPRVEDERVQVNVGLTVIGSKDWTGKTEEV